MYRENYANCFRPGKKREVQSVRAQRAINRSLLGDVVGEGARIRERKAFEWH